jgi:hypothetical protein
MSRKRGKKYLEAIKDYQKDKRTLKSLLILRLN